MSMKMMLADFSGLVDDVMGWQLFAEFCSKPANLDVSAYERSRLQKDINGAFILQSSQGEKEIRKAYIRRERKT